MSKIRDEHLALLREMNTNTAGGRLREWDEPGMSELLKSGWRLAADLAGAYFEEHAEPSDADLKHLFEGFAPEPQGTKSQYGDFLEYPEYCFEGSAVRISSGVYVVTARYFRDSSTGAFMLVARDRTGHFRTLWNIKDLAERHYPQKDEIGRWLFLVRRAYYSGPLDVNRVIPLPPTSRGDPRYLIDAYQSADGGTQLKQMSIWEWDGVECKPLLIGLYGETAAWYGTSLNGSIITIRTREPLHSMFSCGVCDLPRGYWRVRVTPQGVQDLGHLYSVPELKWVDELIEKADARKDTSTLAKPSVAADLNTYAKKLSAENGTTGSQSEPSQFLWGMLDNCNVHTRGREGTIELELDDVHLHFNYLRTNGRPYFTKVLISPTF